MMIIISENSTTFFPNQIINPHHHLAFNILENIDELDLKANLVGCQASVQKKSDQPAEQKK